MDLRHLRYFVALAEEGHFGRAAERLHIVQPALSMQIKALEDELGGPLFTRTSRRVDLTEAGELFLVEAQRTLDQAERARTVVTQSLRGDIGSVRIGFAGNAVFTGQLIEDLQRFNRAHPDADLQLSEMAPQWQAEAILEGRLDVGYCPDHGALSAPGLVLETVGTWPLMAALCSDHVLLNKVHLSVYDIAAEPLIIYAADETDEGTLAVLREVLGAEPLVRHWATNSLSVLAMAAAGLGVALVPASLAEISVPGLVYRAVAHPDLEAGLVRLSRPDETSGAVKAFLALARGEEG